MNRQAKQDVKKGAAIYFSLWFCAAFLALGYISMLFDQGSLSLGSLNNTQSQKKLNSVQIVTLKEQLDRLQSALMKTNSNLSQLKQKQNQFEKSFFKAQVGANQLKDETLNLKRDIVKLQSMVGPITGAIKSLSTRSNQPNPEQKEQPLNVVSKEEAQDQNEQILDKVVAIFGDQPKSFIPLPVLKQAQPEPVLNEEEVLISQTQFAILLGNYPTLDKLKNASNSFRKKHQSTVGKLMPRYVTIVVDNQPRYQLLMGPITNALAAAKICYHLQQLNTHCVQTTFNGSDI